jgi:hypothetical protein
MAKIVLGLATPHAPQLRLPIEGWYALREKDETDRRINYAELLTKAKPDMHQELDDERLRERYAACQENLGALRKVLAEANPDVVVVVGDDQHEQFREDNMPMFSVFYGDTLEVSHRSHGREGGSPTWNASRLAQLQRHVFEERNVAGEHPAESALAGHLIDELRNADFDIGCSNRLKPEIGLGHAFVFYYEFLQDSDADRSVVPVMVNTFFPPNQPTPRRCYALGRSLRRAIDSWESDKSVAIIASGGLSHTIVDEEIDHATIDAIIEKDAGALSSLPMDRLLLGTSEIRNWITVAATMEDREVTFIGDYIPAYRTLAGTGCGMAFAYWN